MVSTVVLAVSKTGYTPASTQTIGARIADLARVKYPQFEVEPFTARSVRRLPFLIVGTFTPVNAQNLPTGAREAYRFCLIMADLRSGTVVARAWVRALPEGIDPRPTAFFRDSPAWIDDNQTKGYIDNCQKTRVGDPINPIYLEGIMTASIIGEAIDAYEGGRYRDAIDLYTLARSTKTGNQLRVFNGLYLSNWKLGSEARAAAAFGELIDFGLANGRLGVKILFHPASITFDPGPDRQPYLMWLQQIAWKAAQARECLQVVGNTSNSGSSALNDRLSELRAQYIKGRLEAYQPVLSDRVSAVGVGSSVNLVGTGADDPSDALDRRVDFKIVAGCAVPAGGFRKPTPAGGNPFFIGW